jgi:hypothetical protein
MDSSQRKTLYSLMIVVTAGIMTARVANVESLYDPSIYKSYGRNWPKETPPPWPTFASNDRARWATVKAIVEENTFVIGHRIPDETAKDGYRDEGILFTDGFKSVDVVLHPERQEFFSTKPLLLTLIAAGEYSLLHKYAHWNISEQKWEVVVTILLTLNVLPLIIVLCLFSRLLEEYGTTDWGRLYAMAAACFGTFLTTFVIALNNHVPASCCVFFAMYLLLRCEGVLAALVAGFFAGMAVCMDLPAASFAALGAFLLLWRSLIHSLVYAVTALVVMGAQTWINHEVMGTWWPVYAKFGGPWYEYAGSHWSRPRAGSIDFIHEPKHVYAFHLLFGHHGLFSLSPIWLLSLAGFIIRPGGRPMGWLLIRFVPSVVLVVIFFYIWRTNNYGGWTGGPRWLFWLSPLLLMCLIPTADRLSTSRLGRGFAYLCLAVSVFSAVWPWANVWRHPWIHMWCRYMGWIEY